MSWDLRGVHAHRKVFVWRAPFNPSHKEFFLFPLTQKRRHALQYVLYVAVYTGQELNMGVFIVERKFNIHHGTAKG